MEKKRYEMPVMRPVELKHKGNLLLEASQPVRTVQGLQQSDGLGLVWSQDGIDDEEDDN